MNSQANVWQPNKKQEFALSRPEFEVLYGGARGGGKTEAGIIGMLDIIDHAKARGLVIRENYIDLADWIDRAEKVYRDFGAKLYKSPARFVFPSGAKIALGHFKDKNSYKKYQGQEITRLNIEEITQQKSEADYEKLIQSVRSSIPGLLPQIFLTGNPGGPGHGWVKRRFIDNTPAYTPYFDKRTKTTRIYVPATVEDNPNLLENDPGYIARLEGIKDEALRRAWRYGDWSVFEGQAFPEFDKAKHIVTSLPSGVNKNWVRVIGFDWGYADNACAIWLAISPDGNKAVAYRELYANQRRPSEWGEMIRSIVAQEPIKHLILPHDCFAEVQGNITIAKIFQEKTKCHIVEASTLAKGARLLRKTILHEYLANGEDGQPKMTILNCPNLVRTLPDLVYKGGDSNPEDIDTTQEDHAYDALTVGLTTYRQMYISLATPLRMKQAHSQFFRKSEGLQRESDSQFDELNLDTVAINDVFVGADFNRISKWLEAQKR